MILEESEQRAAAVHKLYWRDTVLIFHKLGLKFYRFQIIPPPPFGYPQKKELRSEPSLCLGNSTAGTIASTEVQPPVYTPTHSEEAECVSVDTGGCTATIVVLMLSPASIQNLHGQTATCDLKGHLNCLKWVQLARPSLAGSSFVVTSKDLYQQSLPSFDQLCQI